MIMRSAAKKSPDIHRSPRGARYEHKMLKSPATIRISRSPPSKPKIINTCVVHLPILANDHQNRSLIVWTTLDANSVQRLDLFALVLVNWLRMFGLVTQEGPHFHHARCSQGQDHVVFAIARTQDLHGFTFNDN
jgi:hypothetical protein